MSPAPTRCAETLRPRENADSGSAVDLEFRGLSRGIAAFFPISCAELKAENDPSAWGHGGQGGRGVLRDIGMQREKKAWTGNLAMFE